MIKNWFKIDRLIVTGLTVGIFALGLQAQVKDNHDSSSAPPDAVSQMIPVQEIDSQYAAINTDFETIKPILKESCFDCHSTQTEFPWYHSLPIVKGLMDGHIEEGLEHLDMSDGFPFNKGEGDQVHRLEEMKEEIEDGGMPILSYRMLHWGSLIEGEEQDSVFGWIDRTTARLADFNEKYPMPDRPREKIKEDSSERDEH